MSLFIVVDQKIMDWERKGEIVENYFNPENIFNDIIVFSLIQNGKPSNEILKKLCGTKNYKYIEINNFFLKNKFSKYFLPKFIYKKLIFFELNSLNIKKPKLIQSIGDGFSGFIANLIARKFKIKSFLTIHSFVSFEIFFNYMNIKEKIMYLIQLRFKSLSHKDTNKILIVYKKIQENIKKDFHKKISLIYNRVFYKENFQKKKYHNNKNFNLVFVGRLIRGKSPEMIIKSLQKIDKVTFTIYGDGPERSRLENLIISLGMQKKVFLKGYEKNIVLLDNLKKFDAFIMYGKYFEFPKTIIESILIGLPVIMNKNPSSFLDEYKGLKILWVNDNQSSYEKCIKQIIEDKINLKKMAIENFKIINKEFLPSYNSKKYSQLLNELIK